MTCEIEGLRWCAERANSGCEMQVQHVETLLDQAEIVLDKLPRHPLCHFREGELYRATGGQWKD